MKVYVVVYTFGIEYERLEVYSSRAMAIAVADKYRKEAWGNSCLVVEAEVKQ